MKTSVSAKYTTEMTEKFTKRHTTLLANNKTKTTNDKILENPER